MDRREFLKWSGTAALVTTLPVTVAANRLEVAPNGSKIARSGIQLINEYLPEGRYTPGTITDVISAPGAGKSAFLISEAVAFYNQGLKVLHYTIADMHLEALHARFLSRASLHTSEPVRTSALWDNITDHTNIYDKRQFKPEYIMLGTLDMFEIKMDEFCEKIKNIRKEFEFDVLLIDNIDLLVYQASELTGFKDLIVELKIPAFVSQQVRQHKWKTIPLTPDEEKQHYCDTYVAISRRNNETHICEMVLTSRFVKGKPRQIQAHAALEYSAFLDIKG
jgi:hypothetical protein